MSIEIRTLQLLKANRKHLTQQQFKTLKGKVLAGRPEAALRGLQTIFGAEMDASKREKGKK